MKISKVFICFGKILTAVLVVTLMLIYSNNGSSADVVSDITVEAIAINPQNTNELYVGVTRSGLYRSIDKGETWVRCGAEIKSFDDEITRIAFDPIEKIVYVGTFDDLFASHDGNNWINLGKFKLVYDIFIQPTEQSKIIYIITSNGLYVSTVDGAWKKRDDPPDFLVMSYPVAMKPSDPGTIYFAMTRPDDFIVFDGWNENGIYKSNDYGKTMEKILSTRSGVLLISPSDTNVMYGMDKNKILKSIDGGFSWKEISKFDNSIIKNLAMNPVNHNVLYAHTIYRTDSWSKTFLFKSIDGGKTWQDISSDSPFNISGNDNGVMDTIRRIVIDQSNPDILYVGTLQFGIFKSTDAGKTWKAINNGIEPTKKYKSKNVE